MWCNFQNSAIYTQGADPGDVSGDERGPPVLEVQDPPLNDRDGESVGGNELPAIPGAAAVEQVCNFFAFTEFFSGKKERKKFKMG